MTISYKVWNFPTFPISKQLFHVPGAAIDGGLTSGGARITSSEPGGNAVLEIQPSLQFNERDYPLSSWLMSKINGEIFSIRLAPTPQVASARVSGVPWGAETIYPDSPWSNQENWSGDLAATYLSAALEGSNTLRIDMSEMGPVLRHGHVIGHMGNCYMVDDIVYNTAGIATITTKPPLRKNVAIGDTVYFRPYFTGSISNGQEIRKTYDAENNGAIQLERIIFNEVKI